jgi:DNA-binding PadR family transcriptional regulator
MFTPFRARRSLKSFRSLAKLPAGSPVVADDVVEFHAARLLLLFQVCGQRGRLDGLTKLAKLDFFLRYPSFFDKVATKTASELQTSRVESTMVKHHYGPWDKRYYHVLAYLEARNLVRIEKLKRTYVFELTEKGAAAAKTLQADVAFETIVAQLHRIKEAVGKFSGSRLKRLIYAEFGREVAQRGLGEVIEP